VLLHGVLIPFACGAITTAALAGTFGVLLKLLALGI